ncbi:MAG: hypothetical protein H6835_06655 [Planctomycetes bacterium]|nr:hypothetical protein [Planctomycetota bacterium]
MSLSRPLPAGARRAYTRCLEGTCAESDCPQCQPEQALERFFAEVHEGRREHLRDLIAQPLLLYHVPRSGGTFLAEVFEQLELLVLRPDYPRDAELLDELLRRGERRGVLALAHSAAAVKARNPDVDFLEYGACWRDPAEICASEYHGIRNAKPGHHLFTHHLRAQCLACDSVADWVERYGRGNPVSAVLGDDRPPMLRASSYAADVGAMLELVTGEHFDLVADFGFDPDSLRPGRWVVGADRRELVRLRELNRRDHELCATWLQRPAPAGAR